MSHERPNTPWHKLGSDVYTYLKNDYLLVVDYHSNYFETVKLENMGANELISKLKVGLCSRVMESRRFLLKCNLLGEKNGLYMLVKKVSHMWLWWPGEYLLVSYSMIFCMEPMNIFAKTSAPPGKS